jgi:hypothetical protein
MEIITKKMQVILLNRFYAKRKLENGKERSFIFEKGSVGEVINDGIYFLDRNGYVFKQSIYDMPSDFCIAIAK